MSNPALRRTNWGFTRDGGFVAHVTGTHISAYAYPTSESAERAKRSADRVAEDLLARELDILPTFVEMFGFEELKANHARHLGALKDVAGGAE